MVHIYLVFLWIYTKRKLKKIIIAIIYIHIYCTMNNK